MSDAKHRMRTLWLTGVLHGFTHLYQVALLPLYLRIQQDLKLSSVEQATLLVTVMGAAYFIPSYPLGVMADRLSRKKLLATGLAINALGYVCLALAPSYGWAVASVVLAGLGGSFYHPAATALIARLFPEARGRALGWVGTGASFGFFIGPLYCGWRAVESGSWRTPILEVGVLGLIGAALFAWLAEDEKGPRADLSSSPKPTPESLFPTPALWALFLGASLALSLRDFTGSAMATSASLFLQHAHQFSPKTAGWALSGIFVASAVSNPLFGRLSDRGRMRWATFLLVMSGILISAFPRVSVTWMWPVVLSYGFFFMATYPITEAALMEAVPDPVRGRVFGFFITIGGFIGNLAHWLVGGWVRRLGDAADVAENYLPLYATLTCMVLTAILGLPCLKAIRKREQHEAPAAMDASHKVEPSALP